MELRAVRSGEKGLSIKKLVCMFITESAMDFGYIIFGRTAALPVMSMQGAMQAAISNALSVGGFPLLPTTQQASFCN